jgi:hypothetical protein
VFLKGYVRTDAALINARYNLDTVIPAEQSLSYYGLLNLIEDIPMCYGSTLK